MLKLTITADEFGKLPETIQGEYKKDGDAYKLDVSGIEDAGELRRAHQRTKDELANVKTELHDANKKIETLSDGQHRNNKDIDALEKSWQRKQDEAVGAVQKKLDAAKNGAINSAVQSTVESLAGQLTDSKKLLMPHLTSRIRGEYDDETGAVTIRVLDGKGNVTAATLEDLSKEIAADADFRGIIRASKASGGGAPNANNGGGYGGGAPNNSQDRKPVDLATAKPKDIQAQIAARVEANRNKD